MSNEETIKLQINGRDVEAPCGVTVHRAAEINGIYIPTLCSHKDLSPFGGCRLCLIEIEGMRGYPLSCNTTAQDGMKVLTNTVAIQEIRVELLQLILSEHPSTCLICSEAEECKTFMGTVRKSGVTTGCRYCPNDSRCELQNLVKEFNITDITYPPLYRAFATERSDPFYDRDYNLCILCGRCVRMCQEMRGTAVLAFNYRGPKVVVGPAFGRNHIEAGCEFCGACVSVCPTGALAEKSSKWDDPPDNSVVSTCPFCAIGCRLELYTTDGRYSMALPIIDEEVNDGQACLKGRFCMGEVSHHFSRARKPFAREGGYWKEKTWDEAIEIASRKINGLKPGEFAMIVSPDLTNEGLYVAQKFCRAAVGTNSIDSTARKGFSNRLGLWADFFTKPISIHAIKKASRILAVGLDTRFNFSIVGVEVRKAMQRGAKMVTIDPKETNLARYADMWLQPPPGHEGAILKALASGKKADIDKASKAAGIDRASLKEAYELLKDGDLFILVGPGVFHYVDINDLVAGITEFSARNNATVLPLYTGANARGTLEMGTFPEFLPGPVATESNDERMRIESAWGAKLPDDSGVTIDDISEGKSKPKVLYLVGAMPFFKRPDCDFLIVQDIYEPDFECDLYLPASSFLESEGTLTNLEGRVQNAPRIENLPDSVRYGRARPDHWIFSEIAKKMGAKGFDYEAVWDIQKEIASVVPEFPAPDYHGVIDRKRRVFAESGSVPVTKPEKSNPIPSSDQLLMVLYPEGYTHRGISMTSKVEGLQILNPENGFFISEADAEEMKICEGDLLEIKSNGVTGVAKARISHELPKGVIYLFIPEALGGLGDRIGLADLYALNQNPIPVEVTNRGV